MPRFDTPHPVDLAVGWQVGHIEVVATDRDDTVVTVTPTNPARAADVRGAEETTVDFDGRRVTVTGPKPRIAVIGPNESVDLHVALPTGSRLTVETAVGGVRTAGRLGATRVKSGMGAVELDATGDLWCRAGHGDVVVTDVDGALETTADHGQVRIGTVAGDAVLRTAHGSLTVGRVGGDLDAKLSYGDLDLTAAAGSVTARTAYGSLRVGEVSSGSSQLETAFGQIVVGVRPGVAAWLDLVAKRGNVRNGLAADAAPGADEPTVAVRARTQFGDVDVRRAG